MWDAIATFGHYGIFDISSFWRQPMEGPAYYYTETYLGDFGIAGNTQNGGPRI